MEVDIGETWLTLADPYILEYLEQSRDWHGRPARETPKTIGLNTPVDRKKASERCLLLKKRGLIEKHDRGVYSLSELGQQFVDGELTTEEINEL